MKKCVQFYERSLHAGDNYDINDWISFLIYRAVMILHTIFSANLGFELVIRTTSHLIHTQNTVKRFVLLRNRELKQGYDLKLLMTARTSFENLTLHHCNHNVQLLQSFDLQSRISLV